MKRELRREQVLQCAAEAFAQQGYHQTSIDDIVKRAKIARGTFYRYFQDKRSIFDELVERFMEALNQRIVTIDPHCHPPECLQLLKFNVRSIFEVAFENKSLAKILTSDAVGLDADFDRKLISFYQDLTEMLERSLKRGQATNIVRPCHVQINAILIVGSIKELLYLIGMDQLDFKISDLVDEIIRHLRDGILNLPLDEVYS